jgi:DNA-binding beta-propeller fold protein YncE
MRRAVLMVVALAMALTACAAQRTGSEASATNSVESSPTVSQAPAPPPPTGVRLPSVTTLPPSQVVTVDVGAKPCALARDGDTVWVTLYGAQQVVQLARDGRVLRRLPTGPHPCGVTFSHGLVWVADVEVGRLQALDPSSGRPVRSVSIGGALWDLRSDGTFLWTDDHVNALVRVNPGNGRIRRVDVGATPGGIAVGPDGVWVAVQGEGDVAHVDPATVAVIGRIPTGPSPTWFANDGSALWLSDDSGMVQRLDAGAGRLAAGYRVGGQPDDGTALDGRVYIPDRRSGHVLVLDAATGRVVSVLALPAPAFVAESAMGYVWLLDYAGHRVVRLDPRVVSR